MLDLTCCTFTIKRSDEKAVTQTTWQPISKHSKKWNPKVGMLYKTGVTLIQSLNFKNLYFSFKDEISIQILQSVNKQPKIDQLVSVTLPHFSSTFTHTASGKWAHCSASYSKTISLTVMTPLLCVAEKPNMVPESFLKFAHMGNCDCSCFSQSRSLFISLPPKYKVDRC